MSVIAEHPSLDRSQTMAASLPLVALLAFAFALRVGLAVAFPNLHHADELFQYLEQGHRMAFGYGVIPWEYRDGARSWILPGLVGSVMALAGVVGGGVKLYMAAVAAVISALSLITVAVGYLWARRIAGTTAALVTGFILAVWYELAYFGAKPLTEAVAANFLFAAAYLLSKERPLAPRVIIGAGLLLGLAFALRMHLAPALLLAAVVGCRGEIRRCWLPLAAAGAAVVVLAGIIDWLTWGAPFYSFWINFTRNIIEGKAASYGTYPWFFYIVTYGVTWVGALAPMAVLVLLGSARAPLLLAFALAVIVPHMLIDHKELRFIVPALPFLLTAAGLGTHELLAGVQRAWPRLNPRLALVGALGVWLVTSVSIGVILSTTEHLKPRWTHFRPQVLATAYAGTLPALCGLGLVDVPWYETGGYAYLHRPVPIYPVEGDAERARLQSAYNVALAPARATPAPGFTVDRCFGAVCVQRREGACTPAPDDLINAYLARTAQ